MVYKHTILSFLEYAGFMVISCTKEDRGDLQKFKIEALRICTRLTDHIRNDDLHDPSKIISLEQRRRIQLLVLMYTKSKDVTMHKVFANDTRNSRRIVFKTDSKEGGLYKRSPYFIGTKLWNLLPNDVIDLPDIFTFETRLKRMNAVLNDPLS